MNHREDRPTPRSWPCLGALALALALGGCASSQGDLSSLASSSDEIVWQAAEKAFQKKQWDSARKYYRRIIDGFPQSEHLPGARLGQAETHFKEGGAGNYILAVSEYREFLTLYPSHPKSDYAQFQTAEAYYLQTKQPRSRPDQHDEGPGRVRAPARRLPELEPRRGGALAGREPPSVSGQGRVRSRLLLPADPQGAAVGDQSLRGHPQRLSGLRRARRGAVPPRRSAWWPRHGRPRRSPT